MAKSEGNFITIRDLLVDWPGEVLRFNMLRTHYRQPMDWTVRGLEESLKTLTGFYSSRQEEAVEARLHETVQEPLLDVLNTPEAINQLHDLHKQSMVRELAQSLKALGFAGNLADPRRERIDSVVIEALIAKRDAARAAKNWQESDRIRDELFCMGIILKDSKHGTSWEIKR
jgi:cysteinyl-tRNA synthetase